MTDHPTDPSSADDDRTDPLAALLRAHAPAALPDDGFVARTMQALAQADPTPARAVRPAPLAIARALALEQRHHATQARLWRWAMAGVAVGLLLLVAAMCTAPGGPVAGAIEVPDAFGPSWAPLWCVLMVGAIWYAWGELRANS